MPKTVKNVGVRRLKPPQFLRYVALSVFIAIGCTPHEKGKNRFDGVDGGAPAAREECTTQTLECFNKCAKREASPVCIGCCRDQDYLCDMQQKYSFTYCDGTR